MKTQNCYANYHSKDINFIFKATLSKTRFKSLIHEQKSENTEGTTSLLPETIASVSIVCHSKHLYASLVYGRFLINGGKMSKQT